MHPSSLDTLPLLWTPFPVGQRPLRPCPPHTSPLHSSPSSGEGALPLLGSPTLTWAGRDIPEQQSEHLLWISLCDSLTVVPGQVIGLSGPHLPSLGMGCGEKQTRSQMKEPVPLETFPGVLDQVGTRLRFGRSLVPPRTLSLPLHVPVCYLLSLSRTGPSGPLLKPQPPAWAQSRCLMFSQQREGRAPCTSSLLSFPTLPPSP